MFGQGISGQNAGNPPVVSKRKKRRLIETPKFYLSDVGVAGQLAGCGPVKHGSESFGRAYEHFIIQETRAYIEYSRRDIPMAYWRSASGAEVDLVLGDGETAVEIKSTRSAARLHTRGLRAILEDIRPRQLFLVTCDSRPRHLDDGIQILPWQDYCQRLWAGEII